MKNLIKLALFTFIVSSVISCSEKSDAQDLICDQDALFTIEDGVGTMIYMGCYDSWAIRFTNSNIDSTNITAASLDIPEVFESDGLVVNFSACFYEFDLPLILPDPAPWGELYVIKDFNISEEN